MSQPPRPRVWPAAEGAWQIRLPLPWTLSSVNVYLFRAGSGYLLLDTGVRSEECLQSLEAALRSLRLGWKSISEILVSHLHPDHVGAAAEIRRRSGAPVRMPTLEAELVRPLVPGRKFFAEAADFLLRHGMPRHSVDAARRQASAGASLWERLVVDGGLESGERIAFDGGTLEAVSAPGHSPSQLCFHCPDQRVLFSTDAVLPKMTPNIGVHWFYPGNPLGDYLETLDRLDRLPSDRISPSHGRPFAGLREWTANTRVHHIARCKTIRAAVSDSPLDAYQIAGRVWGEDVGLMDRRLAMAESLAHLHFMAAEGRVERDRSGGIVRWGQT